MTTSSNLAQRLHTRRIRMLLWVSVGLMGTLGCVWFVIFGLLGRWDIAFLELGLLVTGIAAGVLTHWRRTRLAWMLVVLVGYVTLCLFSVFFDAPDAVAPRTSHLYLLVLTLATMLVFRDEAPALRWSLVAIMLMTFVAFSSSNWSGSSELSIGKDLRKYGSWVNASTAMFGLVALVHIMLTEWVEVGSLERGIAQALEKQEFFFALSTASPC
ncbi:hypothetical protein [Rhodoferax sp.]|uniref:hypothetical protein n=1 Tax=Rhodoferax sp. TaxID=50421 RepID=UPI0025DC02C1|nr:hypothetical protein [Rhodoferax sp.]